MKTTKKNNTNITTDKADKRRSAKYKTIYQKDMLLLEKSLEALTDGKLPMDLADEEHKERFVAALRENDKTQGNLRDVIQDALDAGTERYQLIEWGVEAGYSEGWVRSLVSKVSVQTGKRARKEGGGRSTPDQAITLCASATAQYGADAAKYLLAAYRLAVKNAKLTVKVAA